MGAGRTLGHSQSPCRTFPTLMCWTGGPHQGVEHGSTPHGTVPLSEPGAGHLTGGSSSTKTHSGDTPAKYKRGGGIDG